MNTNSFEQLQREMSAFQKSSVLGALAELDLGTFILQNGSGMTALEISRAKGCDLRGCTALLDCLAALGYFCKNGQGENAVYAVHENYKEMLDSRHPATCIPILRHMACVQRGWSQLAKAVHDGTPQKGEASILGEDEDRISFIMGMNSVAYRLKNSVIASLEKAGIFPLAKTDTRILDVGGASGTYTEAFLDIMPEAKAAIFDLPVGIAQAKKRFSGSDKENHVQLITGDFYTDPLPSGFDFAWVSAIIHQMNRSESQALYKKVFASLNNGGMIAVRDFVMNDNRTAPEAGTLFGLNMLVNTKNGMVYTFAEIKEDLEQAGFTDICHAVDVPTMGAIVTARKP